MQLLSETDGLILADGKLLFSDDGGLNWIEITPDELASPTISGWQFLDQMRGWVLAATPVDNLGHIQLSVARTVDGGATWRTVPVNEPGANNNMSRGGSVHFADADHGWIVWVAVTSSQFSFGNLYRTSDGGATWEELDIPLAQRPAFATANDGVVAGGPAGDKLFVTSDGGESWQPLNVPIPPQLASAYPNYRSPWFFSSVDGVLPVLFASERSTIGFYATSDGGKSWTLTGSTPTDGYAGIGSLLPSDAMDADSMVAVVSVPPDRSKVYSTSDRGASWTSMSPNGLGSGVVQLDFASAEVGWALVQSGVCLSFKTDCTQYQDLYKTTDGGQTWEAVELPAVD